ncbi:thiamine pyrophosphokinase [Camillea tinctor]|nr:thiamine pyrophosphokinase [Camillea tinctor]
MEAPESGPSQEERRNIDWNPIRLFLGMSGYSFALIILNHPIRDIAMFKDLWDVAKTTVAADGGADHVHDLNVETSSREVDIPGYYGQFTNLDIIIGDLDSVSMEARDFFTTRFRKCRIIEDPDQDSSDFTKAVRYVRRAFPHQDIVCMGGLGGRVDQGLSQLHHLYMFQTSPTYAEGRMYLVSGESLTFLLKGGNVCHRIRVRDPDAEFPTTYRLTGDPFGKYVGIVPVGGPSVITTRGLEWDVENWETKFGGRMSTSNHVLPTTDVVELETTHDVLFTIAFKQPLDSHIRWVARDY